MSFADRIATAKASAVVTTVQFSGLNVIDPTVHIFRAMRYEWTIDTDFHPGFDRQKDIFQISVLGLRPFSGTTSVTMVRHGRRVLCFLHKAALMWLELLKETVCQTTVTGLSHALKVGSVETSGHESRCFDSRPAKRAVTKRVPCV